MAKSPAASCQPLVLAGIWRRISAAWVDGFVCYAASYLLTGVAALAGIRLALEPAFLGAGMLYGMGCLRYCGGRTLGKALWGLAVVDQGGGSAGWVQVWLREGLGKWVALGWMPGIIGRLAFKAGWVPSAYDLLSAFPGLLLTLVCCAIFRKTWYDQLAGTSVVRCPATATATRNSLAVLAGVAVLGGGLECAEWVSTGMLPSRMLLYYGMGSGRTHQDFLKRTSVPPQDYIFSLFERYDLVVLSERAHSEMTQWDFIFDLVKDPRFSTRVGHVFTELGQVGMQSYLDEFMEAKGLSEAEIDERVLYVTRNWSVWPRWHRVNFPTYLKRLYALNQSLPPEHRIRHHFTDLAVDWPNLTAQNMAEHWKAMSRRDEQMAQVIVHEINRLEAGGGKRARGLVVMNYRHAFDLTGGRAGARLYNCCEHLRRALQGRVANVRINEDLFWPVAGGAWNEAFAQNGNRPVGFDLIGSPFGQEPFDLFPWNPAVRGRLKYQDVFTGLVLINPNSSQYYLECIPGYYRGWESEMRRRAKLFGEDWVKTIELEIALEQQGRVPIRTEPIVFTVETWVTAVTGLLFVPGFVLGIGAFALRRRIQAPVVAAQAFAAPSASAQRLPRKLWFLFAGATVLSVFVHEIGHCTVAWLYGCPAIPTPAKEYLLLPLPAGAQNAVALGGVLGSVAALLAAGYWLVRKPDRVRAILLAGAIIMPGAYTLRFLLIGRGHDATEFQEAQAALGMSYTGHAVDWLFLALFVLAAAGWLWRTRPSWSQRLALRLAAGFVLGLVIIILLQVGNNALFDPLLLPR